MPQRRPNVLWIMTDQHRADAAGFLGDRVIQTPHLDRLASEAVVFENAFCQSPACMASRASLLTGRYPQAVRVRGMGILPPEQITLPETLLRCGYRTGAFGKVHLTPQQYTRNVLGSGYPTLDWRRFASDSVLPSLVDDPMKQNYGFTEYVGDEDALHGPFEDWLRREAPELTGQPRPTAIEGAPGDLFVSPYPSSHHPTTFTAQAAAGFVRRQTGASISQPWMAFCSFVAPHHPFAAPPEQIDRYRLEDIAPPPRLGGAGLDADRLLPNHAAAINEIDRYPESIQRRIIQHYFASISLIDDNVGMLLDVLERTGQADDTIVVFVADHGEFLGRHGLLRKPSFHFDDTLRVPMLIKAPGLAPRREAGLMELTDLFPTLLGLLDLSTPHGVQGRDCSAALRGGQDPGREDIYADMYDLDPMVCASAGGPYVACVTLRSRTWKLNVYPQLADLTGHLFRIDEDPNETTNLFDDPACREQREAMLWRLTRRMHDQTDPLPLRLTQW